MRRRFPSTLLAFAVMPYTMPCSHPPPSPDAAVAIDAPPPAPDAPSGTLDCSELRDCANPCTTTACITNCLAMGKTSSAALWKSLDDCIATTCSGATDEACCEYTSVCAGPGDPSVPPPGCESCSAKGVCFDDQAACLQDQ